MSEIASAVPSENSGSGGLPTPRISTSAGGGSGAGVKTLTVIGFNVTDEQVTVDGASYKKIETYVSPNFSLTGWDLWWMVGQTIADLIQNPLRPEQDERVDVSPFTDSDGTVYEYAYKTVIYVPSAWQEAYFQAHADDSYTPESDVDQYKYDGATYMRRGAMGKDDYVLVGFETSATKLSSESTPTAVTEGALVGKRALAPVMLSAATSVRLAAAAENVHTISDDVRAMKDMNVLGDVYIGAEKTEEAKVVTLADLNEAAAVKADKATTYTKDEVDAAVAAARPSDYESVKARLATAEGKIPEQASAQNQLADKAFVNSSIATNTAFYISDGGRPFQSLADLETYEGTLTNNDYAFVVGQDSVGNTTYTRYKWSEATETWAEEYVLNNSSFTAAQWEAISSGITSALVAKLGALPTAEQLAASLLAKYEKPATGIPKTDLSAGVQASLDKADAALRGVKLNGAELDPDANRNVDITNIPKAALATALQNLIDGALQKVLPSGSTTIVLPYDDNVRSHFIIKDSAHNPVIDIVSNNEDEDYEININADIVLRDFNDIYDGTYGVTASLAYKLYRATEQAVLQIAPAFSTSATYEVNKLCVYANALYRCTTAITTAGEWDSSKWTVATVQDMLTAFASQIPTSLPYVPMMSPDTYGEFGLENHWARVDHTHNPEARLTSWRVPDSAFPIVSGTGSNAITVTKQTDCAFVYYDGYWQLILNNGGGGLWTHVGRINNEDTGAFTSFGGNLTFNGSSTPPLMEKVSSGILVRGKPVAPLASPAFTGTPTAPTPTAGDESTKVATTKFVQKSIAGKADATITETVHTTTPPNLVKADVWVCENDGSIGSPDDVTTALKWNSSADDDRGYWQLYLDGPYWYFIGREFQPLLFTAGTDTDTRVSFTDSSTGTTYTFTRYGSVTDTEHANSKVVYSAGLAAQLSALTSANITDFAEAVARVSPPTTLFDEFSESATYAVGDRVMHDGSPYQCTTAVETAGAWTGAMNWEAYVYDFSTNRDIIKALVDVVSALGGAVRNDPTGIANQGGQ